MTETEYIIYTITGIVAVVVGRLCYVHIYKYGKSRKQRRAERWRDQGGVAQGTMFDVDLRRAGDPSLDVEELREDLYRVKYHYSVRGRPIRRLSAFSRIIPGKLRFSMIRRSRRITLLPTRSPKLRAGTADACSPFF